MSHTLTETGNVLTETQEGITMPADYSFATVNDYVHGLEVTFEDLLALCLGMANHIDGLLAMPRKLTAENGAKAALIRQSDQASELEKLRANYNELLYSVHRKTPGETRHETALRYIKQMEAPSECAVDAALNALE